MKVTAKVSPMNRFPFQNRPQAALGLFLAASMMLTACGLSPEAQKKARAEKLEAFAKTVTQHLLDKKSRDFESFDYYLYAR